MAYDDSVISNPQNDPVFQAATPAQRHGYLMATDPTYASAPPEHQQAYMASVTPSLRQRVTANVTGAVGKTLSQPGEAMLGLANLVGARKDTPEAARAGDIAGREAGRGIAEGVIPQSATGQAATLATLPLGLAGGAARTIGSRAIAPLSRILSGAAGGAVGSTLSGEGTPTSGALQGGLTNLLGETAPVLGGAIARRTPGLTNLIRSRDASVLGNLAEQAMPGAGFKGTGGYLEGVSGGEIERKAGAMSDRVKAMLDAVVGPNPPSANLITKSTAPTLYSGIPQELRKTWRAGLTPSQGMHALSNVQDPIARKLAEDELRDYFKAIDPSGGMEKLFNAHQQTYSRLMQVRDTGQAGMRQGSRTEFDTGRAAASLNKDLQASNARLKGLDTSGLRRGAPEGYQDVPTFSLSEMFHPGVSGGTSGKMHGFLATSRKMMSPGFQGKPPLDVLQPVRTLGDILMQRGVEAGVPQQAGQNVMDAVDPYNPFIKRQP